jgi:O-antigen/teichoic acid export membrane protein
VLVFSFNQDVVRLWVGAENFAGKPLVFVFSLTLIYLVFFSASSIVLTNHLELKTLATIRFLEGLINLLLSIILVLRFGMIGVASATLIAGLVTSGWFVPYRACRLLHISFRRISRQVFVGAVLFAVAAVAAYPAQSALPGGDPFWLVARFLLVSLWLVLTGTMLLLPRRELARRLSGRFAD